MAERSPAKPAAPTVKSAAVKTESPVKQKATSKSPVKTASAPKHAPKTSEKKIADSRSARLSRHAKPAADRHEAAKVSPKKPHAKQHASPSKKTASPKKVAKLPQSKAIKKAPKPSKTIKLAAMVKKLLNKKKTV